jgi:ribose transport system permease protein
VTGATAPAARSPAITSFVVASRYMPAYLALVLLVIVAAIWAPAALGRVGLSAIAPYGALLAITALGQMLVIMTGGIDLSVPGTFTLAALIMVGVGQQTDERIVVAVLTAIGAASVIGLLNGILIGGLKLNPLIVTLAVGQVVIGVVNRYGRTFSVQSPVPSAWSDWTTTRLLGVSPIFWIGVATTVLFVVAFRYTTVGRRFQVVGANPMASHVVGVRVNLNQISAYVAAGVLYAIAGAALAGLLRTPGVSVGIPYLLGPIAAVVIGGASLTGGLASPLSTFAAAFFLTGLNQMMRVMGLPTAFQFVVFGLVIIGGMLVSGDRIIKVVERVLRERRRPKPTVGEPSRGQMHRELEEGLHTRESG